MGEFTYIIVLVPGEALGRQDKPEVSGVSFDERDGHAEPAFPDNLVPHLLALAASITTFGSSGIYMCSTRKRGKREKGKCQVVKIDLFIHVHVHMHMKWFEEGVSSL